MDLNPMKEFIESHIDYIDDNQYERLLSEFKSIAPTQEWGELNKFLLSAGINPLHYMDYVPRFFLFRTDIDKVTIPEGLVYLGERCFEKCENLSEIIIPRSIKLIDNYSFLECKSLAKVHMLCNTLEELGDSVFEKCTSLERINLSSELSTIPYRTCYFCTNLNYVHLPYGLTEIKEEAFAHCRSLKSIVIPSHVIKLGNRCFGNSGLEEILFGGTKEQWRAIKKYNTWKLMTNRILVKCADGNIIEK